MSLVNDSYKFLCPDKCKNGHWMLSSKRILLLFPLGKVYLGPNLSLSFIQILRAERIKIIPLILMIKQTNLDSVLICVWLCVRVHNFCLVAMKELFSHSVIKSNHIDLGYYEKLIS